MNIEGVDIARIAQKPEVTGAIDIARKEKRGKRFESRGLGSSVPR